MAMLRSLSSGSIGSAGAVVVAGGPNYQSSGSIGSAGAVVVATGSRRASGVGGSRPGSGAGSRPGSAASVDQPGARRSLSTKLVDCSPLSPLSRIHGSRPGSSGSTAETDGRGAVKDVSRPGSSGGGIQPGIGKTCSGRNLSTGAIPVIQFGRAATEKRICKEDIDLLIRKLSEEEQARFEKPLFAADCSRRFEQVGGGKSLPVDELDQAALLKMFPTLKLEVALSDRTIPAPASSGSWRHCVVLFDKNSDGMIDEEEFRELMKFCQAWRATFYVAGDGQSNAGSMSSARRASNTGLKVGGAGVRASSASGFPTDSRRASGFGPRLGLGGDIPIPRPLSREKSKKKVAKSPRVTKSPRMTKSSGADKADEDDGDDPQDRERRSRRCVTRSKGAMYSMACNMDMEQEEQIWENVNAQDTSMEDLFIHPMGDATVGRAAFSASAKRIEEDAPPARGIYGIDIAAPSPRSKKGPSPRGAK